MHHLHAEQAESDQSHSFLPRHDLYILQITTPNHHRHTDCHISQIHAEAPRTRTPQTNHPIKKRIRQPRYELESPTLKNSILHRKEPLTNASSARITSDSESAVVLSAVRPSGPADRL